MVTIARFRRRQQQLVGMSRRLVKAVRVISACLKKRFSPRLAESFPVVMRTFKKQFQAMRLRPVARLRMLLKHVARRFDHLRRRYYRFIRDFGRRLRPVWNYPRLQLKTITHFCRRLQKYAHDGNRYVARGIDSRAIESRLVSYCSDVKHHGLGLYILLADGFCLSTGTIIRKLLGRNSRKELFMQLARGFPRIFALNLSGAEILIRHNARVFTKANGSRISVKVAIPSSHRTGSLAREIKARKLFANSPCAEMFPTMIRYDHRRLSWLEEEYITAEKAGIQELIAIFLSRYALPFYRHTSKPRQLGRCMPLFGLSFKHIQSIFIEFGTTLPDKTQVQTWPFALVHGDLTPGNMLLTADGALKLFDWEYFSKGPVVLDLHNLFFLSQRDKGDLIDILYKLGSASDISPKVQLQIATAVQLGTMSPATRKKKERTLVDLFYCGMETLPHG